jgi:hypothetical protein
MTTTGQHAPAKIFQAIWAGGITAATFDVFAALIIYHGTLSGLAKAIARGWYGPAVKTMPTWVEIVGLASHYAILLVAAAVFVLASLRLPILRQLAGITGPAFGAGIYLVMHYIIVPLSNSGGTAPTGLNFELEFAGHLLLVGLPIALWARAILGRD